MKQEEEPSSWNDHLTHRKPEEKPKEETRRTLTNEVLSVLKE